MNDTAQVELLGENAEADEVISWRLWVLARAGYDETTARALALRRDVDLHEAVELVRRGCPPKLAYRILA